MNFEPLEFEEGSGIKSYFNWDEYLEENGVLAAPHHAFKHVYCNLQSDLAPGMMLEVCVRSEPDTPYWVATIIIACGQLLLLRYYGYQQDRRSDFWCDILTSDLRPLGWSRQQGKLMRPPEGVLKKHGDWRTLLEEALSQGGSSPAHLLKWPQTRGDPSKLFPPGSVVEVQDSEDPKVAWVAVVEKNRGGRLCLRYCGTEGLHLSQARCWVFYLDPLLHPQGWARQTGHMLAPPGGLCGLRDEEEWEEVQQTISEPERVMTYGDFFMNRPEPSPHSFTEGMKLEAIDPLAPFTIGPATVIKVLSERYFLVEMDSLLGDSEKPVQGTSFFCHYGSPNIFPVQWSLKNGVPLCPPPGFQHQQFYWADYLIECEALGAPDSCFPVEMKDHDFIESMRLEAVNPLSPEHIHMATVTKVKGQHIWLQLEGLKTPLPDVITHVDSLDIFPVSWCESNDYPLQHTLSKPKRLSKNLKKVSVVQPEKYDRSPPKATPGVAVKQQDLSQSENAKDSGNDMCPRIYFNHRCFCGPYLRKGRIAELPHCVGPGNCVLVLREVLTLLVSSAYRPSRVLRELQQDPGLKWLGQGEKLKAKFEGKSSLATVGVACTAEEVVQFCRTTCVRLECCPNLISPGVVLEHCSESCSLLTNTKYSGQTNLKFKRSIKRRKKNTLHVQKRKLSSACLDSTPAYSPMDSGEEEDYGSDWLNASQVSDKGSQIPFPTLTSIPTQPRSRPQLHHKKACTSSYPSDENKAPGLKSLWMQVKETPHLDSSPLGWSVTDVARFIRTTNCASLAQIFKDQEIDGQALMLLSLPIVQECMGLKLGPAIELCHLIKGVKLAFYQHFAS